MLRQLLGRLLRDVRGATVIEFALLASLIAVALGSAFLSLGDEVRVQYEDVDTRYTAANG